MTAGRTTCSKNQHWCTPPHYVLAVRRVLGEIALDPCSNEHSVVGATVEYRLPTDGLTASWEFPTVFVNPPYGADRLRGTTIKDWLRKCWENARLGAEVVALVPTATNTSHWKEYVWAQAAAVAFLYDTRLRFLVDGKSGGKGAPMACSMIHWGRLKCRFLDVISEFGAVVDLSSVRTPARTSGPQSSSRTGAAKAHSSPRRTYR